MKLVKANPGITASEIAKQMKIKPNYLYRVMGDLQKEGRVRSAAAATPRAKGPAGPAGLNQAELPDRVALFLQLLHRGVDPLAREVVDLQALDDLPLAAGAGARESRRPGPRARRRSRRRRPTSRPSRRRACRAPSRARGRSRRWRPRRRSRRRAPRSPRLPRFATVGMNSSAIQSSSSTAIPGASAVPDLRVDEVGVLRGGVVAPDRVIFVISVTAHTPACRPAGRSPGCGRAGSSR